MVQLSTETSSTNFGNSVAVLVLTAATSAMLTGWTLYSSSTTPQIQIPQQHFTGGSIFQQKDYELALLGQSSSGNDTFLGNDEAQIATLVSFAEKIMSSLEDVPVDFNRVFVEKIEDILA